MGTNGLGFTRGPTPRNRQPIVLVKVLSDGSTTLVEGQAGLGAAQGPHASEEAHRLAAIRFIPRSLAVGFRRFSL